MVFLLERDFEETIPGNRSVYEENLIGKRGDDLTRQDLFTHLPARKLREAFSSYFSFLQFWPGAESGTISQVLLDEGHPQYIVVPLTILSLKFDPHGKTKSLLDNLFHPAKIQ